MLSVTTSKGKLVSLEATEAGHAREVSCLPALGFQEGGL